jgi:phosphoglycerate dehydrogenase-like enzyme
MRSCGVTAIDSVPRPRLAPFSILKYRIIASTSIVARAWRMNLQAALHAQLRIRISETERSDAHAPGCDCPLSTPQVEHAVRVAGGQSVATRSDARGLVWLDSHDPIGFRDVVKVSPGVAWVQLLSAGVEQFARAVDFDDGRVWTCAKGAYADPVAEHALTLALTGLRELPERIRATTWGEPMGTSLFDKSVTILGGGGVASALLSLLAPFRVRTTVVRRQALPMPGASRVLTTDRIDQGLPDALVVFVARQNE